MENRARTKQQMEARRLVDDGAGAMRSKERAWAIWHLTGCARVCIIFEK